MVIKLLATQIPKYWEVIKFASVKADLIADKDIQSYSIQLLFDLLNEKITCVLVLNDKREVIRILLMAFVFDKITKERKLSFKLGYSFVHATPDQWLEETTQVYTFAKKENCSSIIMATGNPVLKNLAKQYGFTEASINYVIKL